MRTFLLCLALLAAPVWAQDVVALRKEVDAKRKALAVNDVQGRRELAKWCASKKLRQTELSLCREIVGLAPDDEAARKTLGHVRAEGTWHESADAAQLAKGKVRGLIGWLDAKPPGAAELHGHWLTLEEMAKLEVGEPLAAHKAVREKGDAAPEWHDVLTLEWQIRSELKPAETLELARMIEQAVRDWRDDGETPRDVKAPVTLRMVILKDHMAYVQMIKDDIETFDPELAKSHGFFDGQVCWGSFFKDWYRTRRILLHEGRHQYDLLVAKTFFHMPAWYREGTAEYWSVHEWDGKTLKMGVLNAASNEHLHFLQRIIKRKKLKGAEATLKQAGEPAIEAEFYQQSWAFVFFCRTGSYAESFRKWETELLSGRLRDEAAQTTAFGSTVAPDMKAFDVAYRSATEEAAQKFGG